jgi:hypothetical protein
MRAILLLLIGWAVFSPARANGDLSLKSISAAQVKPPYFEYYQREAFSNISLSVGFGASAYFGEYGNPLHFRRQNFHLNPHGAVALQYRLTNYISLRGEFSLFRLSSRPLDTEERFFASSPEIGFRTHAVEYYLGIVHDLFPKNQVEFWGRRWNPYVFAGFGQVYFVPTHPETSEQLKYRDGADYEYHQVARLIPVGLGFNFYPHNHISVGFEAGYRFTNTHFLDGAKALDQPARYDKYLFYGVKLTKQFLPARYYYYKRPAPKYKG